jgi:hypothetical protein
VKEECLIDAKHMEKDVGKREMKPPIWCLLVLSPKSPSPRKQKRKNRNGICCFLKPAFYFFAWSCHLCASFIADSHTKSAVLSARDNRCAGSS